MRPILIAALQALVLILLSYPLLYYGYKFYQPRFGGVDFYAYYGMYLDPLSFEAAKAPFVFRQLHAVVTHLIHAAGIFYPAEIAMTESEYAQPVYFAAFLSNYIGLLVAAFLVVQTVEALHGRAAPVLATVAGATLLFSFQVPFAVLTPTSEGWGLALAAAGLFALTTRRLWLLTLVLVLTIFQRELLCGVLLAVCLARTAMGERPRAFFAAGAAIAAACAALYLGLRAAMPSIEGYPHQLDASAAMDAMLSGGLDRDFVVQGFLSQNVLALSLVLLLVGRATAGWPGREGRVLIADIAAAVAVIVPISMVMQLGPSVGRMLALAQPFACALIGCLLVELTARQRWPEPE